MRACIAAPQPLAAEAGWRVLKEGGNAVDAAVVAALVQTVVDPQNGGLAGIGSACIHDPQSRETTIWGFFGRVPHRARPDMFESAIGGREWWGTYPVRGHANEVGYKSILVPGTVRGLADILGRYGTLSWSQALAPAIEHAANGFPVHPDLVSLWSEGSYPNSVTQFYRLIATPAAAAIYSKPGPKMLEVGDQLVHRDQAKTMQRLGTRGADDFYQGEIAAEIARDMANNGGLIDAKDLADYRIARPNPIRGTYRGYTIVSSPPPDSGITLVQMLDLLQRQRIEQFEPGSCQALQRLAAVMRVCLADREQTLGDPASVDINIDKLTSKAYIDQLESRVIAVLRNSVAAPASTVAGKAYGTSQVSALDSSGFGISLTHTLGSPSGVVTPGLGFMYNGGMHMLSPVIGRPNSVIPGSYRITAMAPTLLYKDGKLRIVIGAAGAYSLLTAMAQVLVNLIDHGMSALEAVSAPRIYCEGDSIHTEARIPGAVCDELERAGSAVVRRNESYGYSFGYVQMITIDEAGNVRGGSDPRKGGMALGV